MLSSGEGLWAGISVWFVEYEDCTGREEHIKKYTVYAEVLNCQLRFIFSLIKSAETVGSHVSLKELELFLQENIKNEANKTFFLLN